MEADHHGKVDEAIEHYEKALSYSPNYYPAHNNLGSAYFGRQNFGHAQAQFEDALKANQNDVEAYFNLANVMLLTTDIIRTPGDRSRKDSSGSPDSPFGQFLQGLLYSRTDSLILPRKTCRAQCSSIRRCRRLICNW